MGEAFVADVLQAMRMVVPPDVELDERTPLDVTTLDSLGLLEAFVHLETITGTRCDEDLVRTLALDRGYDPTMTIGEFADLVHRRLHEPVTDIAVTGGAP